MAGDRSGQPKRYHRATTPQYEPRSGHRAVAKLRDRHRPVLVRDEMQERRRPKERARGKQRSERGGHQEIAQVERGDRRYDRADRHRFTPLVDDHELRRTGEQYEVLGDQHAQSDAPPGRGGSDRKTVRRRGYRNGDRLGIASEIVVAPVHGVGSMGAWRLGVNPSHALMGSSIRPAREALHLRADRKADRRPPRLEVVADVQPQRRDRDLPDEHPKGAAGSEESLRIDRVAGVDAVLPKM